MASFTVPCPKACAAPMARLGSTAQTSQPQQHLLSFHNCLNRCPIPFLQISGLQSPIRKQSAAWKVQAQLSEVTEKSSNSAPINNTKSEDGSLEGKDESTEKRSSNIPDASSISAFMAQVSDLVKLVDSRDIVELQMKQLDLELVIRKKEALEKPAPQAPIAPPPAHYPYAMLPPQQAAAPSNCSCSSKPSGSSSTCITRPCKG
ncbi:unnamed protein product [Prunus armeniaca]|uniref:Uncharacterized protein n=1 Tax=Prunus armeniaca TaxID=36596 RepID=A0A6J5WY14_PRUAR|nr:unnamed protein product [Prunus armeniaca]